MSLRNTRGRFIRNPVSAERYWDRVHRLVAYSAPPMSMAQAQERAAQELKLALILDDAGSVVDWTERTGVRL